MKLWIKILIGSQTLIIFLFVFYTFRLANHATKQMGKAMLEKEEQKVIAEQQADIAEKNAAEAVRAMNEAEEQRRLAMEAQNQVAELKKALARCR